VCKKPAWVNHLRTFGETVTVKIKGKFTPNLQDHGAQFMTVGYSEQHDEDVYCMWNPLTRKIIVTRDVIWLKQMLFKRMFYEEAAELGVELNSDNDNVKN